MSTNLEITSSGIAARDRDPESKELSNLMFPSEHQIVILSTDTRKANQKNIARIPLSFQIRYNGAAQDPPALTMLINPNNMTSSRDKMVNAEYTRGGHVVEEWGEMQEVLQFTGKIGGYYVLNPEIGFSGLNRFHRSQSPSFRNLMNLFMLYRNNGMVYEKTVRDNQDDPQNRLMRNSSASRISERVPLIVRNIKNKITIVGDVFLIYDGCSYMGSFDDFSIEEDASNPYNLAYKFTFIVRAKFEVDKRNLQTYLQRFTELGDIENRKMLSSHQIKQLERDIQRGLSTSQQAVSDERRFLAEQNSVFVNPNSITVPREITSSNLVEASTRDHVNYLNNQGVSTDGSDYDRVKQDMSQLASNTASEANLGLNNSVNTHLDILLKNGASDNPQTASRAANLASEAQRNVNEKKKSLNSR